MADTMNFSDFRKAYPFIAYGEEYANWRKQLKLHRWLYRRLHTERPTEHTCHEWRRLHWAYKTAFDECESAFKALPKPTKEQHNRKYDIRVVGKWPKNAARKIKSFLEKASCCRVVAKDVAAILTVKDYRLKVLKEKTYGSAEDIEMKMKRKRR